MDDGVSPVTPAGTPGSPRQKVADFEIHCAAATFSVLAPESGSRSCSSLGSETADGATTRLRLEGREARKHGNLRPGCRVL